MNQVSQKEKNTLILFILLSIALYCIGLKILTMIMPSVRKDITARMMEGITIFLTIIFSIFTDVKIRKTGFVAPKKNILNTLVRGCIISVGIVIVFIIIRIVMTYFNPEVANRPIFKLYLNIGTRKYYLLIAFVQEFLAKAVMQENMDRLVGEDNTFLSITICSLILIIFHTGYPLYYMIFAGILGMVTGYIYKKDKCIWGCVIIHFCLGFLPRAMGLK